MTESMYTPLGFGITCIDAAYVQPGIACFYLLEEGGECAVLETGTCHSVPALERLLWERGIAPEQVRYIIPTHVHLDHAGGAGAMMAKFPVAQLLIHPRGARHMADPERLVAGAVAVYGQERFQQLYGSITPVDPNRMRQMNDGATVSLAGRPLLFRHTRGHAEHHFCVWDEASRGWFCGDMFGVSYPWCRFPTGDFILPSTTPSQFNPGAYLASLQLLSGFSPQRMYLTHYGALDYSATLAQSLALQINAYCEIAAAESMSVDQLEQRLGDFSLALLHQFGALIDEVELRARLALDMQLNAQGLLMWQQRQASA
jgi:glyoxylase-like metal-dependent hydrolase (beta-lactamase superfamily II)